MGDNVVPDMDNEENKTVAEDDFSDLSTNSVYRTLVILESLSYHEGIILDDLAPIVQLSRPTLFRFLSVLQRLNYVEKDKNNRYTLSPKIFTLASRSIDNVELSKIARPFIEGLSFETGETTIVSILDGDQQVNIQKVESRYTARFYERIGKRTPLYCTASGKILLAGMSDEEFDNYLSKVTFIPYTANTVTNPITLRAQIEEIKKAKYCELTSEHEQDIHTLACPIFDHDNKVIASVSINWPTFRETPGKRDACLEKLRKVALQISQIMGYTDTI
jgi:Transcriptional regulator